MKYPLCPLTRKGGPLRLPPSGTLARWLLVVVLAFPASGGSVGADADAEQKRPQEVEVPWPAFPQPENLTPFVVSATTENTFMIDGASLSVGGDRVVRYTLVIISSSGAQNVSYEAMNCLTGERRLYALGRADKTWSKARNDQWEKIRENTLNRHHAALFSEYFCPLGIPTQTADDLRQSLRSGGDRVTSRP
ncbi:MAG: CNP1-like family protein [Candidatus Accumulibacter sp.]|nr:CNP1-like family protein [Accumulibacter sp.]